MLSVIIESNNQESELAYSLSALVVGAVEGLVSDVIVLEHGAGTGTERVSEAAGCRFLRSWQLESVIKDARGDWILVMEPGARPLSGWVESVSEHIAIGTKPARFSCSRRHRAPLWKRLFCRHCQLETGVILPRQTALDKAAACGQSPFTLARKQMTEKLTCEMVPASALVRL